MPAGGEPFQLELCPAFGMAVPGPHLHHHGPQHHADFQDCPFGSAPAQGPVSQLVAFDPPARIALVDALVSEPKPLLTRPLRSHQPRGPPSLA
jgi:hypothetical protein